MKGLDRVRDQTRFNWKLRSLQLCREMTLLPCVLQDASRHMYIVPAL